MSIENMWSGEEGELHTYGYLALVWMCTAGDTPLHAAFICYCSNYSIYYMYYMCTTDDLIELIVVILEQDKSTMQLKFSK